VIVPSTVHARVGEHALSFSRSFAAPARLLFAAHVEASLFRCWMGPRGSEIHVQHFDARTGGSFHYRVGVNSRYTFFGSYHEVTEASGIVHTWEMLSDPGRPILEILTFVDLPNETSRLEGLSLFTSAEHCEATLAWDESGSGMDESFERLADLLQMERVLDMRRE
jgi:uncharacterized protein YndB with AHSA1/START domain